MARPDGFFQPRNPVAVLLVTCPVCEAPSSYTCRDQNEQGQWHTAAPHPARREAFRALSEREERR